VEDERTSTRATDPRRQAASDPWLSFDNFDHLFFAFIAFQRTPPGQPDFDRKDTNAIAVAKYATDPSGVQYLKTVVVERPVPHGGDDRR
jgi:hypothetical protein